MRRSSVVSRAFNSSLLMRSVRRGPALLATCIPSPSQELPTCSPIAFMRRFAAVSPGRPRGGYATLTIAKADLCAGRLQAGRMQDAQGFVSDLEVFDTEVRRAVREELRAIVENGWAHVFVTGPSGTGKSFNLARFVVELRAAGHVVVYVPTMDNLIDDPMNLVDELAHAVKMVQLPGHTVSVPRQRGYTSVLPVYRSIMYDERDPQLIAIDHEFMACKKACKQAGKRLVLVIDQDNRLWRHAHRGAVPKRVSFGLDSLIAILGCQLVLGGSANNEGWARRTWKMRIDHPVDQVPEEYLRATYPKMTAAQWAALDDAFRRYPMPTIKGAQALSAEVNPMSAEAFINQELRRVKGECTRFFAANYSAAANTLQSIQDGRYCIGPFDLRYSLRSLDGKLQTVYPLAATALESSAARVVCLERAQRARGSRELPAWMSPPRVRERGRRRPVYVPRRVR